MGCGIEGAVNFAGWEKWHQKNQFGDNLLIMKKRSEQC
jgi:hypothetical protein